MRRIALLLAVAALCATPSASQMNGKDPHRVIQVLRSKTHGTLDASAKVAKDPETGEFRAPTAEEEAQLATSRPPSARQSVVLVRADGSLTAVLGEEYMSDSVAVKKADGAIDLTCVPHGAPLPAAAAAAETK